MKLKKLLRAKPLASLLTILISVIPATALDKTIAIGAGQAANFDGFLVPVWQFQKMNAELIAFDLTKKQVAPPQEVKQERSSLEIFAWGFLSGSLAVILAEKLGGK